MASSTSQLLQSIVRQIQGEEFSQAETLLRKLVHDQPDLVDGWSLLGLACRAQDKSEDAAHAFERAARLRPNHETLGNFAASLSKLGQYETAVQAYRQSLAFRPEYPEGLRNLGICLTKLNREAEAEAEFRNALRMRPDYVEVMNNLWALLTRESRYAEAIELSTRIVELCPGESDAWNAHGSCLQRLGQLPEALDAYERSVRIKPHNVQARLNQSLALLTMGNLERGWREYDSRWEANAMPRPPIPKALWRGSELGGKTILIWTEQGLGDTLHFIRYAQDLSARGGNVVLRCPKPLVSILARTPGINRIVPETEPLGPFDVHSSVIDLPIGVGIRTPADIQPMKPYVFADPKLVAHWRDRLRHLGGFRIGVCWQGRNSHKDDRHRSFSPAMCDRLTRVPGVHLISLQKHDSESKPIEGLVEFPGLDLQAGPFMDTAAIIANLDLVIACDSAIGHLAGAMGAPVWLAISRYSDWRWLWNREDTPWYPNTRLFRQTVAGDWETVFQRMANELRPLASRKSVRITISPGEFFDRLSILRIKSERLTDDEKRRNVQAELSSLMEIQGGLTMSPELTQLASELQSVNEELWEVEDAVREHERRQDFGEAFVSLARSVYLKNDRRAAIKSSINADLGSRISEQKSHDAS